jgi:hypothetical protein
MMPEQAEWQPDNDNSGDYRWHPSYARRAIDSLNPRYDTRTLAEKVEALEAEVKQLRALMVAQAGEL